MAFCFKFISVASFLVLAFFLGKGTCDSVCPNGITNITGTTSGKLVYPSSGTYGVNETKCWRIEVPKPYIGLGMYFHSYEIEECPNCECDRLTIGNKYSILYSSSSNGRVRGAKCGRRSPMNLGNFPEEIKDGENIWIRFVSDDTVHYKGFNLSYIVQSDFRRRYWQTSSLNASEDETISFGTPKVGIKNYPADFEWQWLLIVPKGRQVQITFDLFELEQSKDCVKDYLEIRESHFCGAILSKPVCGNNKLSTIQSAGNIVWAHFRSDNNASTTYKGFKASFTSVGQPNEKPGLENQTDDGKNLDKCCDDCKCARQ